MTERADLLVVGAGPAGIAAALAGAAAGLGTCLIDDSPSAGGQIHRASSPAVAPERLTEPDIARGQALRAALRASSVRGVFGHQVWCLARSGTDAPSFRVEAAAQDGSRTFEAPSLVLAPGTSERVIPVPGWTTPGVIGLAAATALMKGDGIVPGERAVVAGCGPLLLAVAAGILKAGGRPAAVVDLCTRAEWLSRLPAALGSPGLLKTGLVWAAMLARAKVPVYHGHGVSRVLGDGTVEAVEIRPVDRDWAPAGDAITIAADALCLGHGLVPAVEMPSLLGIDLAFRDAIGGWVPERDEDGRTGIAGLFVAGDGGGVLGAAAAALQGEIAGLAVARESGRLSPEAFGRASAPLRRRLKRAERFGRAMSSLTRPRDGLLRGLAPETVVCRCEDVTAGEIAAAAAEAHDVNQVKSWTRCGMGPCQGRMCADAVAGLVSGSLSRRDAAGRWTVRPPLRPVPVDCLVGRYSYAEIDHPVPGH